MEILQLKSEMKKFNTDTLTYLNGNKFSNSLSVSLAQPEKEVIYRIELLKSLCKDKNIVHLGFTDHIPLIQSKIKSNNWLHQELVCTAKRCLGIDINAEAVDYVREVLGIKEVYVHDIILDSKLPELMLQKWDYLVIGEVLEHIDNPVLFLNTIKEKYKSCFSKIIITVPNAFELTNIKGVFKHKEIINSDHRYWFTPYTLARVVCASGFTVFGYCYAQSFKPNNWLYKLLLKKFPMLREGIVMVIEDEI